MKNKIKLVAGIFCIGVGIFVLVSGILWVSAFPIIWGVAIGGIGIWQLASAR